MYDSLGGMELGILVPGGNDPIRRFRHKERLLSHSSATMPSCGPIGRKDRDAKGVTLSKKDE